MSYPNPHARPVISIDIDGVLAHFTRGFIDIINKIYPEKNVPTTFEPNDWDHSEILAPGEAGKLWEEIKNTRDFWADLPSYSENVRALEDFLSDQSARFCVYYVTSRMDTAGGTAVAQTNEWLASRGLLRVDCSLIAVRDPKEKLHMLKGIGAAYSIDDYAPTVEMCQEIPNHEAWLLDRPWNRNVTKIRNITPSLESFLARVARAYGAQAA